MASFAAYASSNIPVHTIHALHPQANGLAERPHGPLFAKLSAVTLGPNTALWASFLPAVMAAERSRRNRNLGMSPFQALYGRAPPTPFSTAFGTPPPSLSLPEWHAMLTHVHSYVDGANHRMAVAEKATFDATRARPHTFVVGDPVMLYTPAEATNGLIPPWTAGHVITDAPKAPDFYTVSRRELDGSLTFPVEVPVGRLSSYDTTYAADGGASLQTKRDHHQVVCITQHEMVGDLLSFIVRWHDGTVGPANVFDLRRDCKPLLDAYAAAHSLPQARIKAAADADRV